LTALEEPIRRQRRPAITASAALQPVEPVRYLSPSSFAFLYDECKACFWSDHNGLKRPRSPMPSIFNKIDSTLKRELSGQDKWTHVRGLDQAITIESSDKRITSTQLRYLDGPAIAIRGNYDTLVKFEDGRRALVDLKTSHVKPELVPKYARQLHAYKKAFEFPALGDPVPIDELGLIVWEPAEFHLDGKTSGALSGNLVYLAVPVKDEAFDEFLGEACALLGQPEPPPGDMKCSFCAYRVSLEQNIEQKLAQSLELKRPAQTLRLRAI